MKSFRWAIAVSLMAAAGLVASSNTALGQNVPGSVEITAIGGGYFGAKIYDNLNTQVDTGTTYEYGARLGVNITEGIGIEAAWTYAKPDLNATRLNPDGVTGTIGQVKSNIFELDGLFSLGTDTASFYVVLGAGVTTLQPEIVGIQADSRTNFSGSAGIGGKWWIGPSFGLRAEGRWRWVVTNHTTDAGIWCDPFGICYGYTSSVYGHPDVTGGITVRF